MSKNILLFGGAFDPPHMGHLGTAIIALEHTDTDELWFIPCYSDVFGQKVLSDADHRIAMLDLMIKDFPISKFYVCEREIVIANRAGTYAVIMDFMNVYPNYNFKYIIGSDQARRIREWRNSRDLLKTIPFVVVERNDSQSQSLSSWCNYHPHMYIETTNKNKVSSSNIRLDFAAHRSKYEKTCHPDLTVSVNRYIIENNLY